MTRILIVEDDGLQGRVLARAFSARRPDFTILLAESGRQATELMSQQEVDVVLTDLQMPEIDGFELLAWILNNRPSVPVFTMTGYYGTPDTGARLHALGCVDCFTKPLNVRAVLDRMADTLAQTIRGHVQNVSLTSFLQLIEMERKTCSLSVECEGKRGTLFVRKGALIDARTGDLRAEAAAIAIVSWPNPSITISSHCAAQERAIEEPLGFLLMEAMRVQDEYRRDLPTLVDDGASQWPAVRRSQPPGSPGPPAGPIEVLAEAHQQTPPPNGLRLPPGARGIALVDTATGAILGAAARDGFPLAEMARTAALALRQQIATLASAGPGDGVEELVVSTRTGCELVRPCDEAATLFAFLVFSPDETNLMMARFELQRFITDRR